MRIFERIRTVILCAVLLCSISMDANAIMATASVDRNFVYAGEAINLYIEIPGANRNEVPAPDIQIPDFNVSYYGYESNFSLVNGHLSSTVFYKYRVVPMKTGKLIIPRITIEGRDGSTAETQPISIEVVDNGSTSSSQQKKKQKKQKSSQQSATGPDENGYYSAPSYDPPHDEETVEKPAPRQTADELLLTATTDKTSAYPGEQITLTITFYTAVNLSGNPQYQPPTFKNFISEDIPPQQTGNRRLSSNGPEYAYSEMRTALFAIAPGKGEISEATVTANVSHEAQLDPFSPNFINQFMQGGMGSVETKKLQSRPISIKIKPLPGGAPDSFDGAVGSYSMRSIVEKGTYKEGEPLSLTVSISGTGNLKSVTTPVFPETPDFKVFDTQVSTVQNKDAKLGGKKVFTYLIVPRSAGKKTIPALDFSYFDPSNGHYYTLKSKPVEIDVEKGETAAKNVYFNQSSPGEQVVSPTAYDIRYVTDRNGLGLIGRISESVAALPLFIHAIPVVVFAGLVSMRKFSSYKAKNPQRFLFKGARGKAYRQIDDACDMIKAGQPSEAVSMLYDAFMDYLSNKCGEKVSALQSRKAIEVIREKFPRLGDDGLESIRSLWQELEMHHYAPGNVDNVSAEGLADRCRMILKMLDGKMK